MTKLSDDAMLDLGKLTAQRCSKAFGDVAQLIDDEHQVYALAVACAAEFSMMAASILQDGMHDQNGVKPSKAYTLHYVLRQIADVWGEKSNDANPDHRRDPQGIETAGQAKSEADGDQRR